MFSSFISHALDIKTGNVTHDIVEGILHKGIAVGTDEITRLTTIPAAECAALAEKFGIKDAAGVAEFTKTVQGLGGVFGQIATHAITAQAAKL